ncbi:hypothetical protein M440DRAFT_1034538 [Trichoderma longibrachiatum ATCC 18648]|uniref:Uncharacterized protein n=1 Tax=Trichoderma longibrachiatum ATCC 18648 TaxID=983965 RepID=A0A2T4BZK4_TRILO|nr:hypothetical protein M440DRAFT_1034538 [Trichoderma longibrachiatum ATCC 18648]
MGLLGGLWCRRSAAAIGIAALGVAPGIALTACAALPDLYLSGHLLPFTSYFQLVRLGCDKIRPFHKYLVASGCDNDNKSPGHSHPASVPPPASPSGQTLLRLLASRRNPSPFMPRLVSV